MQERTTETENKDRGEIPGGLFVDGDNNYLTDLSRIGSH